MAEVEREPVRSGVVVAVDGSEHSRRALEWGAGEARVRQQSLRIVHAFPFDHLPRRGGPDPQVVEADVWLRDLAAHARLVAGPSLTVAEVVDGLPTRALLEESRHCSLLVLGSRGLGGFERLLLGSTAADVAARAACPVAVIPAGRPLSLRRDRIVVGVDAAPGSERALHFAFARADEIGAELTAMHMWDAPKVGAAVGRAPTTNTGAQPLQAEAERLLAAAVTGWQDRYPRVAVEAWAVRENAVRALAEASRRAEVVVVGARGRSAVAAAVLGSVSQGLLQTAAGPVVVAR